MKLLHTSSALLVLALTLLPAGAAAQVVVGTVTAAETGEHLPGAWVVLETEAGDRPAGTLTGEDGGFALRVPSPGSYRLVVELIGYTPTRSEPLELGSTATVRHDVAVGFRAIELAGIRAEVGERCRPRPGSGPVTVRLWEEARKALEIVRWTEETGAVRFRLNRFRREVDPASLRVREQEVQSARGGYYKGSPYESLPADSLHDHGYVQREADGQLAYYGPDAALLLSESFLDAHCFRVVPPSAPESRDQVGLGFEPVPGRELPDIRGVLWLDAETGELDRVEFTYTRLPFGSATTEWEQVGGRVDFERLSNGMWIVRRWHIRMPVVRLVRAGEYMSANRQLELAALNEIAAEVTWAVTLEGEPLLATSAASLAGTVEGADGRLLEGATVEVVGTPLTAVTDRSGRYRIGPLPAGHYTVRVRHGEFDAMRLGEQERLVEVVSGEETELKVAVSWSSEAATNSCVGSQVNGAATLLHGTVRDTVLDRPVTDAVVRVRTAAAGGAAAGRTVRRALSDSSGFWQACIDPALGQVQVAAVRPGQMVGEVPAAEWRTVDVGEAGFVRSDLPIAQSGDTGGTAPPPVQGRVVDPATGQSVAGALVTLTDGGGSIVGRVLTGDDGRFVIGSVDPGRLTVGVEALGYASAADRVIEYGDDPLFLEIGLSPAPVGVEGIVVTVTPQKAFLKELGFYDRMGRGGGRFVGPDQVAAIRAARPSDLVRRVAGVQLAGDSEPVFSRSMVQGFSGSLCAPNLYVDGVPARLDPSLRDAGDAFDNLLPPPEQIEAIELYPGGASIPVQWRGSTSTCGVIVVWTKR